jgi:hypothetical protein
MAPKAQTEPSWIGGPTKGLGTKEPLGYLFFYCSLEAGSSFKRTQILVKLPSRFHGLDS